MSATATGLTPNTAYKARITAANALAPGGVLGDEVAFATLPIDAALVPGSPFAFGPVTQGGRQTQTFTFTNNGTVALANLQLQQTDGDAAFAVTGDDLAADLGPGASDTFGIEFAPAATGAVSATFEITGDGLAPVTLVVSGDGVLLVPTVSPTATAGAPFTFGGVVTGADAFQVFTFENPGTDNAPATGLSVAFESGDAAFEITSNTLDPTVGPSLGTETFEVRFNPTTLGLQTATFRITGANLAPIDVVVTGVGVSAPVVATGPAQNVGETTADLEGVVNPGALATDAVFELAEGTDATAFDGTEQTLAAAENPVSGTADVTVTALATGLAPNTDYVVRLAATNGVGTSTDPGVQTFRTTAADVAVTPATFDFGTVAQEGSAATTFTFANNSSSDLTGLTLTRTTGDVAFAVGADGLAADLSSGASDDVTIAFAPTAATPAGTPLTATFEIAGAGITPVPFTVAGEAVPLAPTVTPAALAFGNVETGTTTALTVQFENPDTDGAPATGLSVAPVTGSDPAFTLAITPALPTSVAAGGTASFDVAFAPTALGPQAATFRITGDNLAAIDVTVDGTGVSAPVVTTGPAQNVGETTADLEGVVNPGALATDAVFELAEGTDATAFDGTEQTLAAAENPVSGTADVTVTALATGLAPNTDYVVRLAATNGVGTSTDPGVQTFRTAAADVAVTPATFDFGTVAQEGSAATTFTFANNSSSDLTGLTLTRTTGDAAFAVGADGLAADLSSGASDDVTIAFAPTAATPTGTPLTATFEIAGAGITPVPFTVAGESASASPTLAVNAGLTVGEGATAPITSALLQATDPNDGPGALVFELTAAPNAGTLDLLSGGTVTLGVGDTFTQADVDGGLLSYTHDGSETGTDAFGFTVTDGTTVLPEATFAISITGANDAPVAVDDAATTDEGVAVVIDVLANDTDAEGALDPATVAVTAAPVFGTASVDPATGAVTYTPAPRYNGTDSFAYTVADAGGLVSNEAAVALTIDRVGPPNLIANGDAEDPLLTPLTSPPAGGPAAPEAAAAFEDIIPSWTPLTGDAWAYRSTSPEAQRGLNYFFAGASADAELVQDVDLSAFATAIDAGTQAFAFTGYLRSFDQAPADLARIVLEYRDAGGAVLDAFDTGDVASTDAWQEVTDLRTAPVGARTVRVRLISTRQNGTNNDGYFDNLEFVEAPAPAPLAFATATPADGATGVAPGTTITFAFDRAVDPASLDGGVVVSGSAAGAVSGTTTASGSTVTFTPDAPFTTGETVTATATTALLATDGGRLGADVTITFGVSVPSVLYVSESGSDANGGTSWSDAFRTPQKALQTAAAGTEIWIAAGTYYPDEGPGLTNEDPAATFALVDGTAVRGGFAGTPGTEGDLSARDPAGTPTLLSGDVQGDDTDADGDGIVTSPLDVNGTNSYHIVTAEGLTLGARLDGLVLTGGAATGSGATGNPDDDRGGALFVRNAAVTGTTLVLAGSQAAAAGGAVYLTGAASDVRLVGALVAANAVTGPGGDGGAIKGDGGALTLANALVAGNGAPGSGAALSFDGTAVAVGTSTFTGNDTPGSAAVLALTGGATATLDNSILWQNAAAGDDLQVRVAAGASLAVRHALVEGGTARLGGAGALTTDALLDADPLFADLDGPDDTPLTLDDDVRLLDGSPALEAGDPRSCCRSWTSTKTARPRRRCRWTSTARRACRTTTATERPSSTSAPTKAPSPPRSSPSAKAARPSPPARHSTSAPRPKASTAPPRSPSPTPARRT